jgi:putative N-acetyltransferase (TIGR04045 family)
MFFIDPSSHEIGRSSSSAPAAFTPSVRWGIGIDADDFRLSPTASSERFSFHLLRSGSPLLAGYWQLRSDIFCQEQHLFEASDRDKLDRIAYPIVAINHALAPEQVRGQSQGQVQVQGQAQGQAVGVVRILEQSPRVWYGGRLGVDIDFRRHNQIGKGLIWKAVTTANGWGCDQFLATVQQQNVRFFQRLHWQSIQQLEIRGVAHQLMQADLSYYQPARERRPALVAA